MVVLHHLGIKERFDTTDKRGVGRQKVFHVIDP
jgi:hypothetical protein